MDEKLRKLTLPGEIWRDIEMCPNYMISSYGRLYRCVYTTYNNGMIKRPHIHKICSRLLSVDTLSPKGYQRAKSNGVRISIHREVAKAFIPNTENKYTVNHIDGNKLNNRADNLEWMTYAENTKHAAKLGLLDKGVEVHTAKLDEKSVKEIRDKYVKNEYGMRRLAREYGITPQNVDSIVKNKTWRHIL